MSTGNGIGKFDFTKMPWLQNALKGPKTLDQIIRNFVRQNVRNGISPLSQVIRNKFSRQILEIFNPMAINGKL